jgi:hypothetical protein
MSGVIACITFYFISKILISFFLLERVRLHSRLDSGIRPDSCLQVHIVNNQDGTRRLGSRAYKICLSAISLYIGFLILAAFGTSVCTTPVDNMLRRSPGRVGEMDDKRSCHIGLKVSSCEHCARQELISLFSFGCKLLDSVRGSKRARLIRPQDHPHDRIRHCIELSSHNMFPLPYPTGNDVQFPITKDGLPNGTHDVVIFLAPLTLI